MCRRSEIGLIVESDFMLAAAGCARMHSRQRLADAGSRVLPRTGAGGAGEAISTAVRCPVRPMYSRPRARLGEGVMLVADAFSRWLRLIVAVDGTLSMTSIDDLGLGVHARAQPLLYPGESPPYSALLIDTTLMRIRPVRGRRFGQSRVDVPPSGLPGFPRAVPESVVVGFVFLALQEAA